MAGWAYTTARGSVTSPFRAGLRLPDAGSRQRPPAERRGCLGIWLARLLTTRSYLPMVRPVGPLSPRFPCKVVYVIDEPERRGFACGTLPGNPEYGEERFVVYMASDGTVNINIRAFARPASWTAAAIGRISNTTRAATTERYLRALPQLTGTQN